MSKKKPDPKKHSDIRVPDEDIRRDKEAPDFNEALKRVIEKKNKDGNA